MCVQQREEKKSRNIRNIKINEKREGKERRMKRKIDCKFLAKWFCRLILFIIYPFRDLTSNY